MSGELVARNYDILALLVEITEANNKQSLLSLSRSCRYLREACLLSIFREVYWPHSVKHDSTGLLFFPESLWTYIRRIHLRWPNAWTSTFPPTWGSVHPYTGDYVPHHIENLVAGISRIPSLTDFSIDCPFTPPISILNALSQCPHLSTLTIRNTPLDIAEAPSTPLSIKRISFCLLDEILRVGDGPHEYITPGEYWHEWKKRYRAQTGFRRSVEIRRTSDLLIQHAVSLQHIELSGDLCSILGLASHNWPNLHTLVLTGSAVTIPVPIASWRAGTQAEDIAIAFLSLIRRMPHLRDLRLLFSETRHPLFRIVPNKCPEQVTTTPLGSLTSLAISNACELSDLFVHTTSLARLAILAIIRSPRVPTGLNREEVCQVLEDVSMSPTYLKQLRIVLEFELDPVLCWKVAHCCPELHTLEIELCGYHDGKSIIEWEKYAEPFSALRYLRRLRICIKFPEFEDSSGSDASWHLVRSQCALYMAAQMPVLEMIGFEYRKCTGTHRYQDAWLEFGVQRTRKGIKLHELPPRVYNFPEVWEPVEINL